MNNAYYTAIGIDVSDRKSKICVMSMVINFILDPPRSHWFSARP